MELGVLTSQGETVSASDMHTDAEIKLYPVHNDTLDWCYVNIHHRQINAFTSRILQDGIRFFIHKSVVYQRRKDSRGIQRIEKPTVSGLVFLQGSPKYLQFYLARTFPTFHLVRDCSTHLPAVIRDSIMQPFIRVAEISPERVRFLLHPFSYYANGNVKVRIVSGLFAGLEGYIIRIARDRRLVMDIGGMSVAISGVYGEKVEPLK